MADGCEEKTKDDVLTRPAVLVYAMLRAPFLPPEQVRESFVKALEDRVWQAFRESMENRIREAFVVPVDSEEDVDSELDPSLTEKMLDKIIEEVRYEDTVKLHIGGETGRPELERAWARVAQNLFELWKEKHSDYGDEPIRETGEQGLMTRTFDKLHRIKNLMDKDVHPCVEETIDDSLKDAAAYCILWLLYRRGWFEKGNADA